MASLLGDRFSSMPMAPARPNAQNLDTRISDCSSTMLLLCQPDRIEFRQEFSTDNVKWTEMAHGGEIKTAG
jgi:hypothetical protein